MKEPGPGWMGLRWISSTGTVHNQMEGTVTIMLSWATHLERGMIIPIMVILILCVRRKQAFKAGIFSKIN